MRKQKLHSSKDVAHTLVNQRTLFSPKSQKEFLFDSMEISKIPKNKEFLNSAL